MPSRLLKNGQHYCFARPVNGRTKEPLTPFQIDAYETARAGTRAALASMNEAEALALEVRKTIFVSAADESQWELELDDGRRVPVTPVGSGDRSHPVFMMWGQV